MNIEEHECFNCMYEANSSEEEPCNNCDMWNEWKPRLINDNVNHPSHYCNHPSKIECITITKHHNFCIGNAIKYLWRAGLKGQDKTIEDLRKAIWYIQQEIETLEDEK